MKFKVGDKVRVKTDLITKKNYNGCEFKETMKWTKGREFTVDICAVNGYILCLPHYIFTDDMLELVEQPTKDPSQFTKADLKNKMIIETQNGELYLIVDDVAISQSGFLNLSTYTHDLKIDVVGIEQYDIIGVYKYVNTIHDNDASGFDTLMNKNILTPIWKRPQLKPITKSELAKMGYKLEDK